MASYVKTQREVASALGVNRHTVKEWLAEGAPGLVDGTYSIDAIRQWREVHKKGSETSDIGGITRQAFDQRMLAAKLDKIESEARIKAAEARIKEFEAKRKTDTIVHLDDVERFLSLMFAETRRVLSKIPIEMKMGYPEAMRDALADDLESRHNMALRTMSGYCRRITEIRGQSDE